LIKGWNGLADQNGDGRVSVTELFNYVARNVATATQGRQNPVALTGMLGDQAVSTSQSRRE
jgi:hypothetical protein